MFAASFPSFGQRRPETATEDMFIRKFVSGTWHNLFVSEILVKRQGNLIRIAGIVQRSIHPRKMYFLVGYTEELLSFWLQCPVKLELQSVDSKSDVVFKYV
jgi:small subunit ribosomal protein S24